MALWIVRGGVEDLAGHPVDPDDRIVAPLPDGAVRVGVVSDGDPWSVRWVAEAEPSLVPPPDAHGPSPQRLSATSEMATAVELVLDAAADLGPRP